jgi:hypothetical protein
VQKLSIKKTVLLEKMVILFFWELCNTFTQIISFLAAKVFMCDRQTVIISVLLKKHERILKELK